MIISYIFVNLSEKKTKKLSFLPFGKYKAKAIHNGEVSSREIMKEVAEHLGTSQGTVLGVMLGLSTVF